jgi:hypothetical protein
MPDVQRKVSMQTILIPVLIILIVVVSLALILGLSIGLGWVLTLITPFTLFEGSLLGMIAVLAVGLIWFRLLRALPPFEPDRENNMLGDDEDEYDEEPEIPESRFWRKPEERTWENWFRYILANAIYEDVWGAGGWIGNLDERQQEDLSIRLATTALEALKKRAAQTRKLRLTPEMLRQQLVKEGQRPYDDDVLDLTVASVNIELIYLQDDLREVARNRLWDRSAMT